MKMEVEIKDELVTKANKCGYKIRKLIRKEVNPWLEKFLRLEARRRYGILPCNRPLRKPRFVEIGPKKYIGGTRYAIFISKKDSGGGKHLVIEHQITGGRGRKRYNTPPLGPYFYVDYKKINEFISTLKAVVNDGKTRDFKGSIVSISDEGLEVNYGGYARRLRTEYIPKEKAKELIECVEEVAKTKLAKSMYDIFSSSSSRGR